MVEVSDTIASNCFASAAMRAVPSPVEVEGSGVRTRPVPLSDTVSFQSDCAVSNVTLMRAEGRWRGKAYFTAFMINSVTIRPRLTAWLVGSVPVSDTTLMSILCLGPTIDDARPVASFVRYGPISICSIPSEDCR